MTDSCKNSKDIDTDIVETEEWLDALSDLVNREGEQRASFILNELQAKAYSLGISPTYTKISTQYKNTLLVDDEPEYPGNIQIENRLEAIHRWNAAVIVAKANKTNGSLGGHIGSGASIMTLYEVGFNHFFKAPTKDNAGDLIFYQGHTTPVIYARSFLEGRLTEKNLKLYQL